MVRSVLCSFDPFTIFLAEYVGDNDWLALVVAALEGGNSQERLTQRSTWNPSHTQTSKIAAHLRASACEKASIDRKHNPMNHSRLRAQEICDGMSNIKWLGEMA
jgi:hypothetical protein